MILSLLLLYVYAIALKAKVKDRKIARKTDSKSIDCQLCLGLIDIANR